MASRDLASDTGMPFLGFRSLPTTVCQVPTMVYPFRTRRSSLVRPSGRTGRSPHVHLAKSRRTGANPKSRRSGANPQTYKVHKHKINNHVSNEDRSNHNAIATIAVVSMSQRIVKLTRIGRMATESARLGWKA